jgi:hypothetical protein
MPHRLELQQPIVSVETRVPTSGLGLDKTSSERVPETISLAMQAVNSGNNLRLQEPVDTNVTVQLPSVDFRSE